MKQRWTPQTRYTFGIIGLVSRDVGKTRKVLIHAFDTQRKTKIYNCMGLTGDKNIFSKQT